MERDLNRDLDWQEAFAKENGAGMLKVEKEHGKRRHSFANFLHLK
jgi:hypothetical protein